MIDLLSNNVFTEAKILARTESIIRSKFSANQEMVINRKATGQALGQYIMTADDLAEIAEYQSLCVSAQAIGSQARVDNQKLIDVIAYEKALARLAQFELSKGRAEQLAVDAVVEVDEFGVETIITPAVPYIAPIEPLPATIDVADIDGNVTAIPNPAIAKDEAERTEAQIIVNEVTQDTLALYDVRNPSL